MQPKNEKITLENNKVYYIIWQVKMNNEIYYYAISENKKEILFCEIDEKDNVKEILDREKIKEIVDTMMKEISLFYD